MAGEYNQSRFNHRDQLIKVSKTVAFDGSAGNGAVGTIDVFTISADGWVALQELYCFCTEDIAAGSLTTLVLSAAGIDLGVANSGGIGDARNVDAGDGFASGAAGLDGNLLASSGIRLIGDDVVFITDVQITNGTLVVVAFYKPISDGATLTPA